MISFKTRVAAFVRLGVEINNMVEKSRHTQGGELDVLCQTVYFKNPWFTRDNVLLMLASIASMLKEDTIEQWTTSYPWLGSEREQKTVAVIMAGNIPAVGFHDMLCVLISGHKLLAKLSSKDDCILPFLAGKLCQIEPSFAPCISFEDGLMKKFDAVIATGSDNSSRYFDYYFKNYPSIIRRNRRSVSVLTGAETRDDLLGLSRDVFNYFGLGCRNVSKLFVPHDFDITKILSVFDENEDVQRHFKYMNNYEYNKSIYLLNQETHLDNGFVILKEDHDLFSPISVVYYEKYTDISVTREYIKQNLDFLQCIVSNLNIFDKESVGFGFSQMPRVDEYADDINTITFLETI